MVCFKCNKDVAASNSCECDGCRLKFHYACTELTASEIRCLELKAKRTLKFFCEVCQEGLRLLPIMQKKIDSLESRLDLLINKLDTQSVPVAPINKTADDIIDYDLFISELEERKRRANNIMVYNLPESTSTNFEDKINDDLTNIITATSNISPDIIINKTIRIGKIGSKPRPLKVILNSSDTVLKILKNKTKLNHPTARVSSDLTSIQRNHILNLRTQLENRKANGEVNLTIKYVHGVPRIVTSANTNRNRKN